MKKLRLILTSLAIVIAVVAAFSLRENKPDCTSTHHYYYDGSHYKIAGQLGTDYVCAASTDTCTYIRMVDEYAPCRIGTYTPIR